MVEHTDVVAGADLNDTGLAGRVGGDNATISLGGRRWVWRLSPCSSPPATALVLGTAKATVGIRVSEEEGEGLDFFEHGMLGYGSDPMGYGGRAPSGSSGAARRTAPPPGQEAGFEDTMHQRPVGATESS